MFLSLDFAMGSVSSILFKLFCKVTKVFLERKAGLDWYEFLCFGSVTV